MRRATGLLALLGILALGTGCGSIAHKIKSRVFKGGKHSDTVDRERRDKAIRVFQRERPRAKPTILGANDVVLRDGRPTVRSCGVGKNERDAQTRAFLHALVALEGYYGNKGQQHPREKYRPVDGSQREEDLDGAKKVCLDLEGPKLVVRRKEDEDGSGLVDSLERSREDAERNKREKRKALEAKEGEAWIEDGVVYAVGCASDPNDARQEAVDFTRPFLDRFYRRESIDPARVNYALEDAWDSVSEKYDGVAPRCVLLSGPSPSSVRYAAAEAVRKRRAEESESERVRIRQAFAKAKSREGVVRFEDGRAVLTSCGQNLDAQTAHALAVGMGERFLRDYYFREGRGSDVILQAKPPIILHPQEKGGNVEACVDLTGPEIETDKHEGRGGALGDDDKESESERVRIRRAELESRAGTPWAEGNGIKAVACGDGLTDRTAVVHAENYAGLDLEEFYRDRHGLEVEQTPYIVDGKWESVTYVHGEDDTPGNKKWCVLIDGPPVEAIRGDLGLVGSGVPQGELADGALGDDGREDFADMSESELTAVLESSQDVRKAMEIKLELTAGVPWVDMNSEAISVVHCADGRDKDRAVGSAVAIARKDLKQVYKTRGLDVEVEHDWVAMTAPPEEGKERWCVFAKGPDVERHLGTAEQVVRRVVEQRKRLEGAQGIVFSEGKGLQVAVCADGRDKRTAVTHAKQYAGLSFEDRYREAGVEDGDIPDSYDIEMDWKAITGRPEDIGLERWCVLAKGPGVPELKRDEGESQLDNAAVGELRGDRGLGSAVVPEETWTDGISRVGDDMVATVCIPKGQYREQELRSLAEARGLRRLTVFFYHEDEGGAPLDDETLNSEEAYLAARERLKATESGELLGDGIGRILNDPESDVYCMRYVAPIRFNSPVESPEGFPFQPYDDEEDTPPAFDPYPNGDGPFD